MILSRGRRYLFIHIPKTGGTSMALALESRAMKDDLMLGDTPKARRRRHRLNDAQSRGRLWKHSTLSDLDGIVSAAELDDLFVFTLVRNPWDRMVSYYHWLRDQDFEHQAVALSKRLEFRSFAAHPATIASIKAGPARSYVTDASGRERCAAYIRIEHFSADAQPLWEHLGFELELDRVNASDRDLDWRGYYDAAARDAVAEAAAEDIARFGYVFDPV